MATVSTSQMKLEAPLEVPLPEAPSGEHFTPAQWTTLMAIMDAVIPAIHRESTTSYQISQLTLSNDEYTTAMEHLQAGVVNAPAAAELDPYLAERASEIPLFQDLLRRTLIDFSREDARKGLSLVLSTLK
jgi:hypothetical protein